MALFALYHAATRGRSTAQQVNDWLAGNLCRCTGYRPIVDAALAACAAPRDDRFSRAASRHGRARLTALDDSEDVFIGDERALLRGARDHRRRSPSSIASIPTRRSSPARPTSGCGSPSSCATCRRSSGSAASRGLDADRGHGATRLSIGAAVTLRRGDAASRGASIRDLGELLRRFGCKQVRACRHGRRQHRQRLADRRPAAGADRARRDARAAARRAAAHAAAGGFLHRLRQAGPRGRASSCAWSHAEASAERALPLLQDLQALRPGHLRRDGRVQAAPRRHGASPARASRSAAWRRSRSARAPPRRR